MITQKEIKEIRQLLQESERPLFFFDDDPDGLCSYLLLKKYVNRGKGIVAKSSPVMDISYIRKINELTPDKVFILDKAVLQQEFVDQSPAEVVWIDHHEPIKIERAKIFNPRIENPQDNRPTSYWCYKIVEQNMWIAMCGIIGDWFLPEFTNEFEKKYPTLLGGVSSPGEALYETKFGQLTKVFAFILKGNTTDVNKCISILEKIEEPYEILDQTTPRGKYIYRYFQKINRAYEALLQDALKSVTEDQLLIYTYPSTRHSFTGELANELLHRFPNKIIIIGREKSGQMKMSLRSKGTPIAPILKKALEGIEGYGGGHDFACGSNIKKEYFPQLIESIREQIREKNKQQNQD
ncbi:DHH family phosphoesterase [Candidatus Woesearchaeota archaeon]|nr:DHH family phosphoesterase [Candidatus Woesearchaeota archaeon]